jgi:hypothetical protein
MTIGRMFPAFRGIHIDMLTARRKAAGSEVYKLISLLLDPIQTGNVGANKLRM